MHIEFKAKVVLPPPASALYRLIDAVIQGVTYCFYALMTYLGSGTGGLELVL